MAWRLLLSLIIAFVGLWCTGVFGGPVPPDSQWVGWLMFIPCAAGAAGWVLWMIDRSDQIIIDQTGLTYRRYSDEHIPWNAVRRIDARKASLRRFFAVYLNDFAAHPPSRLSERLAVVRRALGFGDFFIQAWGTDRTASEIENALVAFGGACASSLIGR